MAIDEDLGQIETGLRQLQIEWEKFFSGADKKPPNEMQARIADLVRRHAYAEIRNNTTRFRYQTLSARFNTFTELWMKRLRALEEGRPLGVHGGRPTGASGGSGAAAPRPPLEGEAQPAGGFRIQDAGADALTIRALYESYMEARQTRGEGGAVQFEKFAKLINQQTMRLRSEMGVQAVDFRLETKDGKVTLKAKPIK